MSSLSNRLEEMNQEFKSTMQKFQSELQSFQDNLRRQLSQSESMSLQLETILRLLRLQLLLQLPATEVGFTSLLGLIVVVLLFALIQDEISETTQPLI